MRFLPIAILAVLGIVGCGSKTDSTTSTDTKTDAVASAPKEMSLAEYNAKFKPLGDAIDAAMKETFNPGATKEAATAAQTNAKTVVENSEKGIIALTPPADIKPIQAMVVAQLDTVMPIVIQVWDAMNKGDKAALAKIGPQMDALQKKSDADMQKAFTDAGYDYPEFKKNNDFKKTDATKAPAAADKPAAN